MQRPTFVGLCIDLRCAGFAFVPFTGEAFGGFFLPPSRKSFTLITIRALRTLRLLAGVVPGIRESTDLARQPPSQPVRRADPGLHRRRHDFSAWRPRSATCPYEDGRDRPERPQSRRRPSRSSPRASSSAPAHFGTTCARRSSRRGRRRTRRGCRGRGRRRRSRRRTRRSAPSPPGSSRGR